MLRDNLAHVDLSTVEIVYPPSARHDVEVRDDKQCKDGVPYLDFLVILSFQLYGADASPHPNQTLLYTLLLKPVNLFCWVL